MHLRHLAIVRDTLLKGKSPIFVYFTFKNYKKLVDEGKGFWEAVATVSDSAKGEKHLAASLSTLPDLDKFGFPKLEATQFLGQRNDASPQECALALNVKRFRVGTGEPILSRMQDGTYSEICYSDSFAITHHRIVIKYERSYGGGLTPALRQPDSNIPALPETEKPTRQIVRKSRKGEKPMGRPRKYLKAGIPDNVHTLKPDELKRIRDSQEMAAKYERSRLEQEIKDRIEEGEDPATVTHQLLAAVDELRKRHDQGPFPAASRAKILHEYAGGPVPDSFNDDNEHWASRLINSNKKRNKFVNSPVQTPYWPSIAAHSYPARVCGRSSAFKPAPESKKRVQNRKRGRRPKPESSPHEQISDTLRTAKAVSNRVKSQAGTPGLGNIEPGQAVVAPRFQFLPSIAAHSGSFLPVAALLSADKNREQRSQKNSVDPEESFNGWRKFMSKYYDQQLSTMTRLQNGVSVGTTQARRKRPREPPSLRPKHFKIIVFKLVRLKELNWFKFEALESNPAPGTSHTRQRKPPDMSSTVVQQTTLQNEQIPKVTALAFAHVDSPRSFTPISSRPGGPDPHYVARALQIRELASAAPNAEVLNKSSKSSRPLTIGEALLAVRYLPENLPSSTTQRVLKRKRSLSTESGRHLLPKALSLVTNAESPLGSTLGSFEIIKQTSGPRQSASAPVTMAVDTGDTASEDDNSNHGVQVLMSSQPDKSTPIGAANSKLDAEADTSRVEHLPSFAASREQKRLPGKRIGQLSRTGGSSAILRQNTLLELMEMCGGVLPNHRELSTPFTYAWNKKGQEGRTEWRTLQNTIAVLSAEGKVRQLTFSARTDQGLIATKSMILLSSVDNLDPQVQDTQAKMMTVHPRLYHPAAIMPPKDKLRLSPLSLPPSLSKAIPPRAADIRENWHEGSQSNRDGVLDLAPKHRASLLGPGPPSRTLDRPRDSSGRVQRLASLHHQSFQTSAHRSPFATAINVPSTQALVWLEPRHAFSEDSHEENRSTTLPPTAVEEVCTPYARYDSPRELPKAAKVNDGVNQASRQTPEVGKREDLSLVYSDVSDISERMLRKPGLYQQSRMVLDHCSSKQSPKTPWLKNFQRMLLVGFMDPEHYVHIPSGTFSVGFAGLQQPRKMNGHLGICTFPHGGVVVLPNAKSRQKHNEVIVQSQSLSGTKPPDGRFAQEVDSILNWELETTGVQNAVVKDWPIIHHAFPHFHVTTPILRKRDVESSSHLNEHLTKEASEEAQDLVGENVSKTPAPAPAKYNEILPKLSRKRRRTGSLTQEPESYQIESDSRPRKKLVRIQKPLRRVEPRLIKSFGELGEQRLLAAVMAVRALAGGLEKLIDWGLVAKVFESKYDKFSLMDLWEHVLAKYSPVLPNMETEFESWFMKAYEDGKVPVLNYTDLEGYEWKSLVGLVIASMSGVLQTLPELPAERTLLDSVYHLNIPPEIDAATFYEMEGHHVNTRQRVAVIARKAYIYPLWPKASQSMSKQEERLTTARSWVRANIVTPQEAYEPHIARAKLSALSGEELDKALNQLISHKVFVQANKGRLITGRNYDISDFLLDRLKKKLLPTHFRGANSFKQQLDRAFEETGSLPYPQTVADGDMLAILNLIANQRMIAVPVDVPANKWGLLDGGYENRLMDKTLLNFDIQLRPLPAYVSGNPISPFPAPPSKHLSDPMAKIPMWYGIHGPFIPTMWEMAIAAVLALLAMRSGVGAAEIEKSVRPALEVWEIEQIFEWAVDAKVAKKVGCGYQTYEWWWLALGCLDKFDAGPVEIVRRKKGKGRALG